MQKVFIDAGAHMGKASTHFQKKHPEYEIFMFEPNPFIITECDFEKKVIIIREAVWIEDGLIDIYVHKKNRLSEGATIVKEKIGKDHDVKNPRKAVCMDFGKWIKENFSKDDKIIIKMDIEGAEYAVLNHMVENGSIKYVNTIYVEWHWKKMGMKKTEHLKRLKEYRKHVLIKKEYSRVHKI